MQAPQQLWRLPLALTLQLPTALTRARSLSAQRRSQRLTAQPRQQQQVQGMRPLCSHQTMSCSPWRAWTRRSLLQQQLPQTIRCQLRRLQMQPQLLQQTHKWQEQQGQQPLQLHLRHPSLHLQLQLQRTSPIKDSSTLSRRMQTCSQLLMPMQRKQRLMATLPMQRPRQRWKWLRTSSNWFLLHMRRLQLRPYLPAMSPQQHQPLVLP